MAKDEKYSYPSRYGSHKSMVVDDHIVQTIAHPANEVVCRDEHGLYITTKDRLDNGLADCHRWDREDARKTA